MAANRSSLREQVRDYLLDQIARGNLPAGDRIIETNVAKEFGVSAIPVREAIRELVAMRVLEAQPHRGAWVREVGVEETIEAFEVRGVLELLACETAAAKLAGACDPLRASAVAIVEAAKVRDYSEFQRHNQDFHRAIVAAAGSGVLLRVWDSLAFEVRTRFVMDSLTTIDPVELADEHEPIVDAIERGDVQAAGELLRAHSDGIVEHLRAMHDAANDRPSSESAAE